MYRLLQKHHLYCTGCSACRICCPAHAIRMIYLNQEDCSQVASIDPSLCIHCKKCEIVCPVLQFKDNENEVKPQVFAVMAKDTVRYHCSSGGVFPLCARQILSEGGIVCGATWGENFKVHHICISTEKELIRLQHSKYLQSDMENSFLQIHQYLENGQQVLFSACPCQVAGLKAFLGKSYANLYTIDLICNFAPAYPVFWKYLNEKMDPTQINDITFQDKKIGWNSEIHTFSIKNGETKDCRPWNDCYQRAYHSRLMMRKTCEDCVFSGFPRQGDLSIGDFWNVACIDKNLDDQKGTSVVLVNSTKGEALFKKIQPEMFMCKTMDMRFMQYNRPIKSKASPHRDRFYELLQKETFCKAVDDALQELYDVAILGNWSERNYGSELTYYALYHVVKSMGYEVQMVERPLNAPWGPNQGSMLFQENPYKSSDLCVPLQTKAEMTSLNERFKTFLIGSDQLWHPDLYKEFGSICYLDFIYNDKKKISYATSFGTDDWDVSEANNQKNAIALHDFDAISVRENSGIRICKDQFNLDAVCVLDPVFLCDSQIYNLLAQKSKYTLPNNYIGVYMLDIDENRADLLKHVQQIFHIPINIISDAFKENVQQEWEMPICTDASVEDWLSNIKNCKVFVTDSFHGMCFAMLFHKPFIAVANKNRGAVRFTDLLEKLKLPGHLIVSDMAVSNIKPEDFTVDYQQLDIRLELEREASFDWLKNTLAQPKNVKMTPYDGLQQRLQESELEAQRQISKLQQRIDALDIASNRHEEVVNRHEEVVNRHEEVVNRHEEVVNRHEQVINWDWERLKNLEYRVNDIEVQNSSVKSHIKKIYKLLKRKIFKK